MLSQLKSLSPTTWVVLSLAAVALILIAYNVGVNSGAKMVAPKE